MRLSLREKLHDSFFNPVYDTFTTKQAAARFRVSPASVTKAVNELRLDGVAIYRNRKTFEGRTINVYRLGRPSKRYLRNLRAGRTQLAIAALNGQA